MSLQVSTKRGPTRLPLPETRFRLRFGSTKNASASCFVPECWIGFLSLIRNLSGVRCFRVVVSPLAECAYALSGHDRCEINVERDRYADMWAPKHCLHNFTFLYQRPCERWHQKIINDVRLLTPTSSAHACVCVCVKHNWCDHQCSQHWDPKTASMKRRVSPQAGREIEIRSKNQRVSSVS